jgi:hypothetical protein
MIHNTIAIRAPETPEIIRCIDEQAECKAYLDAHGFHEGAWRGLCDWLMEETLVRLEGAR